MKNGPTEAVVLTGPSTGPDRSGGSEPPDSVEGRFLPLLLVLFISSGCAALIYEVVWFQLLQLVIGSSAVSLGVLLGTFMGGMCLGSLLLPRVLSPRHHPLRVYALLELGIGVIGLLVLFLLPFLSGLYTTWGGYGLSGFLLRGLVASVCLLPPTLLMGATLPAVARWIEMTPKGVSWLGFFYGGNLAGAVFGCLLAGFYLLRLYDVATATYVAAALNVAVAGIGYALAGATPHVPFHGNFTRGHSGSTDSTGSLQAGSIGSPQADSPHVVHAATDSGRGAQGAGTVYVAIALSGLCALGAEVIWTRMLALLFGGSVYSFSIILAVFLLGLGIGSGVGSFLSRSLACPLAALGWCQLFLSGGIAWAAYMLSESLPYWPINPSIASDIRFTFQLDIARAVSAVLPAAFLWGVSFPLALGSVASKEQDAGRLVGSVYAANTVGAIIGALGASLLLVAWLGSQRSQQLLIVLSVFGGLLVLTPRGSRTRLNPLGFRRVDASHILIAVSLAGLSIRSVPPVPGLLVAYGRFSAVRVGWSEIIYMGEGLNSDVAVSRLPSGVLNYHNAGKVQASSEPQDMRLQRMLGHFTTLVPENPRTVLVIGCGAGITAGAVTIDPKVERVTIAEIEPLVPQVVSTYFNRENYGVIQNPKVQVYIDDARHYLLTTDEKFDAITSDPFDPWVKGAATLYTREFFEVVKDHLNPGGVVTVFVQLYQSTPEAVRSEVATFFEIFPNGIVWGNTVQGKGYDMVLLGQVEPTRINIDEIERRLSRPEYSAVARSLREIGVTSAVDLFATYAGRGPDLTAWLKDAAINRDRNLRLQYLAGMGLNLYQSGRIYADLLAHRRYPEDLFTGSEGLKQSLRYAILRAPGL